MSQEHALAEAVAFAREEDVMKLLDEKLAANVPAADILSECNRGMVELGERFAREECFLPDLMFGGMIIKAIMAKLTPLLGDTKSEASAGVAVMGAVQHDVHDIGKDIVVTMLRGVGFEVIDLGVDVSPEKFVEAVRQHKPAVMGMSVLLTTCFKSVIATVEAIEQAGVREGLSIMVGGAAAGNLLAEKAGCDFYGKTAIDGVKFAGKAAGMEA